jgi:hypothetical protein
MFQPTHAGCGIRHTAGEKPTTLDSAIEAIWRVHHLGPDNCDVWPRGEADFCAFDKPYVFVVRKTICRMPLLSAGRLHVQACDLSHRSRSQMLYRIRSRLVANRIQLRNRFATMCAGRTRPRQRKHAYSRPFKEIKLVDGLHGARSRPVRPYVVASRCPSSYIVALPKQISGAPWIGDKPRALGSKKAWVVVANKNAQIVSAALANHQSYRHAA